MYRRKLSSLPPDFSFPKTLKDLGYFINDQDQVRMIEDPELPFHYFASKNERFLQTQKQAWTDCVLDVIFDRLKESEMVIGRLPRDTTLDQPHVPIVASTNLARARRVVAYFGDLQELGILSGRMVTQEGVNVGSVINFAKDAILTHPPDSNDPDAPKVVGDVGVVIANPGQLVWWRRGKKAVSFSTWQALPRKSAVHEAMNMTDANKIPRNHNAADHMKCVFEDILAPLTARGVKLDFIAVNHAVDDLVELLGGDWARWKPSVNAIVCVASNPYSLAMSDEDFIKFWGKRARFYILDREHVGTPLTGRQFVGCNVYSSGVPDFTENIVPRHYGDFLDYFKLVDRNPDYENAVQSISDEEEQTNEQPGWGIGPGDDGTQSDEGGADVKD